MAPATRDVTGGVDHGTLQHAGFRFTWRFQRHPRPAILPTLFVSGAFQTMDSWARFVRAFGSRTSVVLVDPPGIGQSDHLPARYGADFLADCVLHLLDHLGLHRVNVVSASYGTPIAFRLAQRRPERVHRVVLAGTTRRLNARVAAKVRESIATAQRRDLPLLVRQVIAGLFCDDPSRRVARRALAERVLGAVLMNMTEAERAQYITNSLRVVEHVPLDVSTRVHGPVGLVFTGEFDTFTPPDECRQVANAFDEGWFTTVRNADHLFHLERGDVILELIQSFMEGRLRPMEACTPLVPLGPADMSAVSAWTPPRQGSHAVRHAPGAARPAGNAA